VKTQTAANKQTHHKTILHKDMGGTEEYIYAVGLGNVNKVCEEQDKTNGTMKNGAAMA
jgi:hypothetical protein